MGAALHSCHFSIPARKFKTPNPKPQTANRKPQNKIPTKNNTNSTFQTPNPLLDQGRVACGRAVLSFSGICSTVVVVVVVIIIIIIATPSFEQSGAAAFTGVAISGCACGSNGISGSSDGCLLCGAHACFCRSAAAHLCCLVWAPFLHSIGINKTIVCVALRCHFIGSFQSFY